MTRSSGLEDLILAAPPGLWVPISPDHVLYAQGVQRLGLSQGGVSSSVAFVHLHTKEERIMHHHPSLMVNMETMYMLVGQGIGKDIIPSSGCTSAMCSTSVVTRRASPPVGLGPNINEVIGAQCLLQAGESAWIPIEITDN